MDKNGYNRSLLPTKGCYMCGAEHVKLDRHEVFQGRGRREKCKREGCWISLCRNCHKAVTQNNNVEYIKVKQEMELAWLNANSATVPDFIREFGRNYL